MCLLDPWRVPLNLLRHYIPQANMPYNLSEKDVEIDASKISAIFEKLGHYSRIEMSQGLLGAIFPTFTT